MKRNNEMNDEFELIFRMFTVGVIVTAVLKVGIMFAQWLRPFAEAAIRAGLM